jgi:hypothetical protein
MLAAQMLIHFLSHSHTSYSGINARQVSLLHSLVGMSCTKTTTFDQHIVPILIIRKIISDNFNPISRSTPLYSRIPLRNCLFQMITDPLYAFRMHIQNIHIFVHNHADISPRIPQQFQLVNYRLLLHVISSRT